MAELRDKILERINDVRDPCSLASAFPIGLSDMGLVSELRISEPPGSGRPHEVALVLRVTAPGCMYVPFMERSVRAALSELDEVGEISIEWQKDASWTPADMAEPVRRRLAETRARRLEEYVKRPAASRFIAPPQPRGHRSDGGFA